MDAQRELKKKIQKNAILPNNNNNNNEIWGTVKKKRVIG